jgi:hypothetical protein
MHGPNGSINLVPLLYKKIVPPFLELIYVYFSDICY